MTRRPILLCAAAAVAILAQSRFARAQQMGPAIGGLVTSSPAQPVSPQNGIQVGEGVLLHTGVGVEGGYDTNVFYNDAQRAGSALLRVTPFLDLTNTARNGEVPSGLFFDARASLTYREYFTDQSDVSRLRAFTPALSATLEHNPKGSLALGVSEIFSRSEEAPYVRGTNQSIIIRNNNVASAQLRWSPGGGRLQGMLRYTNTLDLFETDYLKSANSLGHEAMLDVSWRWLPKTALFLQVRQGYIGYLNTQSAAALTATSTKISSFPLRATMGIRGLITAKTSVAVALGYQNAFYSNGVTTGGFLGSTSAAAELVVLPTFSTRVTVGVRHDFQNSVIGNFYYNDGGYLSLAVQTPDKLVGQIWGSFDYRQYYGLPGGAGTRDDKLIQAGAMLDYYLKSWAYAGLSYTLQNNQSDYQPLMMTLAGVNYTKHQVFARLGFTY